MKFKCNKKLYKHISANLQKFSFQKNDSKKLTKAAVAITIIDYGEGPGLSGIFYNKNLKDDAAIILTRRSSKLKNHAGQWAIPGGRIEDGENPEDTALRELEEEVGLRTAKDNIIGRLDDFSTRSGFIIIPVIVWGGHRVKLTPNPDEVDSIHRIPISEFMREDAPILQETPDSINPILFMPFGNSFLAAPTAAILYQFREVAISGLDTRVGHYEQPYFAWS